MHLYLKTHLAFRKQVHAFIFDRNPILRKSNVLIFEHAMTLIKKKDKYLEMKICNRICFVTTDNLIINNTPSYHQDVHYITLFKENNCRKYWHFLYKYNLVARRKQIFPVSTASHHSTQHRHSFARSSTPLSRKAQDMISVIKT